MLAAMAQGVSGSLHHVHVMGNYKGRTDRWRGIGRSGFLSGGCGASNVNLFV